MNKCIQNLSTQLDTHWLESQMREIDMKNSNILLEVCQSFFNITSRVQRKNCIKWEGVAYTCQAAV